MDDACLDYRLTAEERRQFDEQGFLVVADALDTTTVQKLTHAVDGVTNRWRPVYERERALKPHQPLNILDFIGQHDDFLRLIDLPQTFMKVVDILGWHIQLYHSHMIVTPPLPEGYEPRNARLGWHQDSGRLNLDIESSQRPRISLKVGFFLTDTRQPDRGNFHVVPGSHLANELSMPDDDAIDHPEAIPVLVGPGDAVFFDRRLWHSAGRNFSMATRKVLFYGYSYRWLKPRDDMTVAHYMERSDPVRQQLLGASPNGGFGYTSPADEDVPLKVWLQERLGENAVVV
ncbi:MAG: phytanoyl-CoA dioxygenase family protein [Pseudomonadota bacterium]|nr:phytanoyl-CoA dioxygenase family protein [Pseudomonadota bacterium]